MKKYLAMILVLLVPSLALPKELPPAKKPNPIFNKILKLRPTINKGFAMELSGYIAKYSKQFKTDPMLSVAIAMQESSLENKNREGAVMTEDGTIVRGITDVGVFQIHIATIANEGIDADRLKTDVDYQTYWHTKILAEKIKTCTAQRTKLQVKAGNEWSCYHSFTYSKRSVYVQDVGVHLAKIRL